HTLSPPGPLGIAEWRDALRGEVRGEPLGVSIRRAHPGRVTVPSVSRGFGDERTVAARRVGARRAGTALARRAGLAVRGARPDPDVLRLVEKRLAIGGPL